MKIETKEQPAAFEEDNINLLHVLLFYDPIPLSFLLLHKTSTSFSTLIQMIHFF